MGLRGLWIEAVWKYYPEERAQLVRNVALMAKLDRERSAKELLQRKLTGLSQSSVDSDDAVASEAIASGDFFLNTSHDDFG